MRRNTKIKTYNFRLRYVIIIGYDFQLLIESECFAVSNSYSNKSIHDTEQYVWCAKCREIICPILQNSTITIDSFTEICQNFRLS